jgi:hypothetical protein
VLRGGGNTLAEGLDCVPGARGYNETPIKNIRENVVIFEGDIMKRRDFLKAASVSAAALAVPGCSYVQQRVVGGRKKPNIVYIMLDELAYFELSCMGNKYLQTANIDRMAAEGMRFTQALAGAPVCAPTRSVLMTGQHMGHTTVRTNPGGVNKPAMPPVDLASGAVATAALPVFLRGTASIFSSVIIIKFTLTRFSPTTLCEAARKFLLRATPEISTKESNSHNI